MSLVRARAWLLAPLAALLITAAAPSEARADAVPGSQGTDTSLPATDSLVTVTGRGGWSGLTVTVNQTRNLTNQAISVSWSGAPRTISGPGRFAGNYLQIMQCWGDPVDDPMFVDNPGPPPEQCVQGAASGVYGGLGGGLFPPGLQLERIVSKRGYDSFDPALGFLDPRTGFVWRPFRAVNGKVVDVQTNPTFNPSVVGGNYWLNPFFNIITTNEIAGGVTGADGTGIALFEAQTGVQSSGLGCGQRVQPTGAGDKRIPRCWLVVVPRGTPAEENVGTPFAERADQFGVVTSPLAPAAWASRIAIELEFNPVDSPCTLADTERRLAGNELVLPAVASWQPLLCAGADLPPYSYAPVSDASARQQLTNPSIGSPGMVVVNRPIPKEQLNPGNPVVYAPLAASGLTIGFNVERFPRPTAPEEQQALAGLRVASMNLTPRLVAKLLTQSYTSQVAIVEPPGYAWSADNAVHLGDDPDFLQFNPEFTLLSILNQRTFGGLQLPAGSSDAAGQVWEWILADPEARAWLAGAPDPWGMRVNPVYSIDAAGNSNGVAFGDPLPTSFPKADPYCYVAPRNEASNVQPPPLCGTDWVPFTRSFAESAQVTRTAADRPRINLNPTPQSATDAWLRELPQSIGQRAILSLTDTPSAALFGLQMASLSRAGDNGADRTFIAPTQASLTAGVLAMRPRDEPQVWEPDPSADAPGAYPLTMLSYGASAPLALDQEARQEYAAFVEYAVGPGQEPGFELGRLPTGYAPLPDAFRLQALVNAEAIRVLQPPPPPAPPPTPDTTVAPTTVATTVPPPVTPAPRPAPAPPRPAATTPRPAGTAPTTAAPTTTVPATEPPPPATEAPATSAASTIAPARAVEVEVTAVTPSVSMGLTRFTVPAFGVLALAAALLILEITKRPRRARAAGGLSAGSDGPPATQATTTDPGA